MSLRRWRSRLLVLGGALGACQFPSYDIDPVVAGGAAAAGSGAGGSAGNGGSVEVPDACDMKPCLQDGRCIPVDGTFVCLCPDGFRGDTCELNFDDCDPDPCQNGGTCVDGSDTSHCECADGWDGATCQHSVDDCEVAPCQNGGTCVDGFQSFTCDCQPGFLGAECRESVLPTCLAIHDQDASAKSGVFTVDPDRPGQGNPPLEVFCDMTESDGGWTRVGEERQGDGGTFKFLGISVGDPSRSAHLGESALIGEQFQGLYDEVRLGWASDTLGTGALVFRINEEVFVNNVRKAMPISSFTTTDARLQGWVNDAGGAVLCRASEDPDVRPGDTSWAIKPKNDTATGCGCSNPAWTGRGAFYGGHENPTACNPSGGGWAGVADNGEPKGDVEHWELQIWIR